MYQNNIPSIVRLVLISLCLLACSEIQPVKNSNENLLSDMSDKLNKNDVVRVLSDGEYKDWTLDTVTTVMGGDSCVSGTYWRFYEKDFQWIQFSCKEGKWRKKKSNWSLKRRDNFSWFLRISEEEFILKIREYDRYQKLILRLDERVNQPKAEIILIHIHE